MSAQIADITGGASQMVAGEYLTGVPLSGSRHIDQSTGDIPVQDDWSRSGQLAARLQTRRDRQTTGIRPCPGRGAIEAVLLRNAISLIDKLPSDDPINKELHLEALAGVTAEMWNSAVQCSDLHHDILAVFEDGVIQANSSGDASRDQLEAFREALAYLRLEHLAHGHADAVRRRFVDAGFGALGFAASIDLK